MCVCVCVCVCVCACVKVVTSLERILIKFANGRKIMELAYAQAMLFDTENAQGRKLQTEKITFEVCSPART